MKQRYVPSVFLCWLAFIPARAMAMDGLPMTPAEMDRSAVRVAFSMPMMFGDNATGFAPELGVSVGSGKASAGLSLPMASFNPDQGESHFEVGNPTLDGRYMTCLSASVEACFGLSVELGLGVWELQTEGEASAMSRIYVGVIGHQSLVPYFFESIVFRPAGIVSLRTGRFFLEGQFGAEEVFPLFDENNGRDTLSYLSYQLGFGTVVSDLFVPSFQFMGLTRVSGESDPEAFNFINTLMWLNIGIALQTRIVQPFARLAIAMNDESKFGDSPVQISLGLQASF